MVWTPLPSEEGGRQYIYSDAVIRASLTMKVLFGMVDIVAPSVRA